MADDALKSLYGAGHAAASRAELAKTRTRECVAMPGARNQTVLTPQIVIDGLLELFWPDGIAFDAAHGPGSIVPAAEKTSTRGLLDPWPHRTYVNPPYGACLRDPVRDGAAAHEHEVAKAAEKAAAKAGEMAESAGTPEAQVQAGEVAELGAGVEGWRVGDPVLVNPIYPGKGLMGEMLDGGLAEYCVCAAEQLIRIPAGVSFAQAAALPVAYGTAHRMMFDNGGLKGGEKVLILGASGGVGTCCVILAKMMGCEVVVASQSQDKLDKQKDLWVYPDIKRLGIELDPKKGLEVENTDGAAKKAGIKKRDEVIKLEGKQVRTYGDMQQLLHEHPADSETLKLTVKRKDEEIDVELKLEELWRVTKIERRAGTHALEPFPEFWGKELDEKEKKKIGAKEDDFACEVTKFWVKTNAQNAGMKVGDIVFEVDGVRRSDYTSNPTLWIRLNYKPGDTVTVKVLRAGKTLEFSYIVKAKPW